MSILEEFMTLLVEEVEKNCNLKEQISLKELPAEGGIYAEVGEGYVLGQYYNKAAIYNIPVLFLSRNADQRICMEKLEHICMYLSRLKKYPVKKGFSWIDTEIAKMPSKVGRDEDGTYHYSCILNCKLYF